MSRSVNFALGMNSDLSASRNSDPIRAHTLVHFGIQAVYTGTLGGTFKLQCSNDEGKDIAGTGTSGITITNWSDVASSSSVVAAAGDTVWAFPYCTFRWLRVVWTATSGTGVLASLRVEGKVDA